MWCVATYITKFYSIVEYINIILHNIISYWNFYPSTVPQQAYYNNLILKTIKDKYNVLHIINYYAQDKTNFQLILWISSRFLHYLVIRSAERIPLSR